MTTRVESPAPVGAPDNLFAVQRAVTRDVDEQAALLRGWNQHYDQTSRGEFIGSFLAARFDDVEIFREVTSNSLHQSGYLAEDSFAVGIPLRMGGQSTFCGAASDGSQLQVFSGSSGFEFHSPGGLDIVGIVLPAQILKDALRLKAVPQRARFNHAHLRHTSPEAADKLRCLALTLMSRRIDKTASQTTALHLSQAIKSELAEAVVDALTADDHRPHQNVPQSRRGRVVQAAIERAMDAPAEQVTVDDMCRAAGVSRRTLQHCFTEVMDLTPAAYLKVVRLNGVRRALKTSQSVTDAAALWGFWHFGRFAADYKAMFGELPSAAFRRHNGHAAEA